MSSLGRWVRGISGILRLLRKRQPEFPGAWDGFSGAGYGIHWPDLDEDLSTEGMLAGARAPKGVRLVALAADPWRRGVRSDTGRGLRWRALMNAAVRHVEMSDNGQLSVPEDVRRTLGFEPGERLTLEISDGAIVIRSARASLKRLQEEVRRCVPAGVSLVDELIAERRRSAEAD